MKIEGKSVYLNKIESADLKKIVEWKNDKDLSDLILANYNPVTLQDVKEWYERNSSDQNQVLFGIYVKEQNKIIGISRLMFIDRISNHAEFGIYIGENSYHGKGLGKEATLLTFYYGFKNLDLHKIFLKVDEKNISAVKVYEKVGMIQEGTLRQHQWVNDSYRNLILFSTFKEDFNYNP